MTGLGGLLLAALALAGRAAAGEVRDPFAPPRGAPLAAAGTPLQRIEIDQLRLVAVIRDGVAPRALVEDETGLGYIAAIGTPIGPRGGAVVAIERGRLRIREPTGELVLELPTAKERRR